MKNEKEETYSNVQINTHEDAIEALRQLLILIGENPDREGLVETPKRILKAWFEIFAGYDEDPKELIKTFTEGSCDDMVILKDIEYYSCCEHHMLPFYGKAHIAYIPNGKVIGVSKLARLLDVYARRMQIQERIGDQVTNLLMEELGCKGAICVIEGQHHCMTSRGVRKKNAQMITSSIKGCFKESEIRNEFLQLIKG